MPANRVILALVASLLAVSVAQADTLVIEAVKQAAGVERPVRGQSMAAVESLYGAPQQVKGPVGQPPITQWVYPGFTVSFEGQTVVHAVVHH
jgi:hypothetical protein